MPTYEYACRGCGHEFEVFHSITADPIKKCPKCGKLKVERKVSLGAGVLFKGGGFYETDYRSESYTKAAEAERKASESGSETKPAGGAATGDGKAPATKDDGAKAKAASTEPTKPAAAPAPSASSGAEPPSKATHPSRVGRGAGNIVQKPPQPKAPSKPSAKPASKAASKPARKRGG